MFEKLRHFVQQSWLLIVASFCFGLLIATVNSALSPRIELNEKAKLNTLMKGLIIEADSFEPVTEKGNIYKASDNKGKIAGFAFVAQGAGFADKIKLVIAVDEKCEKFFGFKVLASLETPGFGSKISEDFFSNQFLGAPADKLEMVKVGNAEKIDSQIIAISGATVSSEAVVKIFNTYIENVKTRLRSKEIINNDN